MTGEQDIVIVGAGIIGACTAYYLTRHPRYDPAKHRIAVLEATRPASGASGKAGGLLAMWAFPEQIVPLSFRLHQELADEYNGYENWGYRRLSTISIDAGQAESIKPARVPEGLDWINKNQVEDSSSLGGPRDTAQVHPYYFTNFMLDKAIESGVKLVTGKATDIVAGDDGAVAGVRYTNGANVQSLDADRVVLTAGPWTSRLVQCPISGLRAHSITVDPGRELSPYALFTELTVKINGKIRRQSPEIYARKKELYICGEGDQEPLPETSDQVPVDEQKCNDLYKFASVISDEVKNGKRTVNQACYLPVVALPAHSSPFIGETKLKNLFIAAGHNCWGINNGPGTGKIMSEMVFDGESSVQLGPEFDPKDYVRV